MKPAILVASNEETSLAVVDNLLNFLRVTNRRKHVSENQSIAPAHAKADLDLCFRSSVLLCLCDVAASDGNKLRCASEIGVKQANLRVCCVVRHFSCRVVGCTLN